jgi:hypothetical protein
MVDLLACGGCVKCNKAVKLDVGGNFARWLNLTVIVSFYVSSSSLFNVAQWYEIDEYYLRTSRVLFLIKMVYI